MSTTDASTDASAETGTDAKTDASAPPELLYHRVLPADVDLKVTALDLSPVTGNLLVAGYAEKDSYLVEFTPKDVAELRRWTLTASTRVLVFGAAAGTNDEFYLCGGFSGTLDFEGQQAQELGSFAAFTTRIAPSESKVSLWTNGGEGTQQFEDCAAYAGGVVSAGTFRNDTTVHTATVTADIDGDAVLSTESTGNKVIGWLKGTGRQTFYSVTPTASGGALLIAGETDVTDIPSVLGSGAAGQTAVVGRFDAAMQPVWVHAFGSPFADVAWDVAESAVSGDVYVVGHMKGGADLGGGYHLNAAGGEDGYVLRFDAAGKLLGARAIAGSADDRATSLVVHESGDVFITGTTLSPDLDLGTGALARSGVQDVFIVQLSPDLSTKWAALVGGEAEDGWAVLASRGKQIAFAGRFQGSFDFLGTSVDSGAAVGGADVGVVAFVFEP